MFPRFLGHVVRGTGHWWAGSCVSQFQHSFRGSCQVGTGRSVHFLTGCDARDSGIVGYIVDSLQTIASFIPRVYIEIVHAEEISDWVKDRPGIDDGPRFPGDVGARAEAAAKAEAEAKAAEEARLAEEAARLAANPRWGVHVGAEDDGDYATEMREKRAKAREERELKKATASRVGQSEQSKRMKTFRTRGTSQQRLEKHRQKERARNKGGAPAV